MNKLSANSIYDNMFNSCVQPQCSQEIDLNSPLFSLISGVGRYIKRSYSPPP